MAREICRVIKATKLLAMTALQLVRGAWLKPLPDSDACVVNSHYIDFN